MSASFEVTISAEPLAIFAAGLAKAPELTIEAMTAAVYEAELYVQREATEAAPIGATHLLRPSILAAVPEVDGDRVIGVVGSPLQYAAPVELGTRPHRPPIQPLIDWVRGKLHVTDQAQARGMAFAIAKKIERRGTPPQPYLVPAAREAAVQEIFARHAADLTARLETLQ